MKIKKGDTILIISGDDKGRKGKVLKVLHSNSMVLVEGLNIQKKHQRPKKEGEKGQIVEKAGPINISKIQLVCSKCGKPTRVGFKKEDKKGKVRICRKCNQVIK